MSLRSWSGVSSPIIAGLVLLMAGLLSGWHLAASWQGATDRGALLHVVWFPCAILLGAWFLSGAFVHRARQAVTMVFAALACAAAAQWIAGAAHCGCFGGLPLHPAVTFFGDLLIVAVSAVALPRGPVPAATARDRRRLALTLALGLPVIAVLQFRIWTSEPARLRADGTIVGEAELVVCLPEEWIGRTLPVLPHVDTTVPFGVGAWRITFFRRDCTACLDHLCTQAPQVAVGAEAARDALIEVPSEGQSELPDPWQLVPLARLSPQRRWAIPVPLVLVIRDGIVQERGDPRPHRSATSEVAGDAAVGAPAPGSTAVPRTAQGCDLGWLALRSQSRHVLSLPGPSGRPAAVKTIISDCACMMALPPVGLLPLGQPWSCELLFTAGKEPEEYGKNLVVVWGEAEEPPLSVPVLATIGHPLTVAPRIWQPAAALLRSGGQATLAVCNHGTQPLRLLYARVEGEGLSVALPAAAIAPGAEATVGIVIAPGAVPSGRGRILLATTDAAQATLVVRIAAAAGQEIEGADAATVPHRPGH